MGQWSTTEFKILDGMYERGGTLDQIKRELPQRSLKAIKNMICVRQLKRLRPIEEGVRFVNVVGYDNVKACIKQYGIDQEVTEGQAVLDLVRLGLEIAGYVVPELPWTEPEAKRLFNGLKDGMTYDQLVNAFPGRTKEELQNKFKEML